MLGTPETQGHSMFGSGSWGTGLLDLLTVNGSVRLLSLALLENLCPPKSLLLSRVAPETPLPGWLVQPE